MIRYMATGDHLYPFSDEVETDFSWWDTVIDRFLAFGDYQMWDCWTDFARDFFITKGKDDNTGRKYELERFRRLHPDSWKEKE